MVTFLLIVGWAVFAVALFRILFTIIVYNFVLSQFEKRMVEFNIIPEWLLLFLTAAAGYVHYFGGGF